MVNGNETKEELDKTMYNYSSQISETEEENRLLRETVISLRNELNKFQTAPFLVAEIKEVYAGHAIIVLNNGNEFYVSISSSVDDLAPGDSVLVEQKNLVVVKKIPQSKKFNVSRFVIIEKPETNWKDIGGLDEQIKEIKEVVELPLKNPEIFQRIGIHPPQGILLYGPPGTGKTMLAKAVASSTNSAFIEIVASELVQKFIGEGAKLVKEIFTLAKERAPAIVFIDELDALAAKRIDIGTSGEREVQRTFMQLLAEIDGFKNLGNVKVIGCTNRIDILDPAILRPGRLDRLIEVGLPDEKARKQIFDIHTKNMPLKNIKKDIIIKHMENFSGADIKAVCTEAGFFAIRSKRNEVCHDDFMKAIEKVKGKMKEEVDKSFFG